MLEDLRNLGVRPGARIMVHASLKKIGLSRTDFGEGGAELLLDALEAAVGPSGTLLMVLGSEYSLDWVNRRPVDQRAGLLAGTEPLDRRVAPAMSEVGWLGEVFRQRAGTRFSDNPSGRFAARGALADELLRDQPWNDYYGPGSPLDRLCRHGGQVLRLGASRDTLTILHFAEYLANLPDKRRVRWDYLLATEGGPRHVWMDCLDDSDGIVPWQGEDYFSLILENYLATGRAERGRVGRAQSELIPAADLAEFGARWMESHLVSG